jgi:hypothetical protein
MFSERLLSATDRLFQGFLSIFGKLQPATGALRFQGRRYQERGELPANTIRLVLERSVRRRPSGVVMTEDHLS